MIKYQLLHHFFLQNAMAHVDLGDLSYKVNLLPKLYLFLIFSRKKTAWKLPRYIYYKGWIKFWKKRNKLRK